MLLIGNEDHRPRFVAQAHARIGNDADDLAWPIVREIRVAAVDASLDDLAQGIGVAEVLPGERLVDDGDSGRVGAVHVGERAPAPEPNAQRFEKLRARLVVLSVAELVARIAGLSDDTERHGHRLPRRQPTGQTDRVHAGYVLHALDDLAVELRDLRRDAEMRGVASRAIAR